MSFSRSQDDKIQQPNRGKYSIWLLPYEDDYNLIYNKIYELSKAYHSPLFQPHCTLFSPVYDIEIAKNIIHKFKMNPFQVPSIGLNQSINIWKAVYIELEKNNQLNQLYQLFNDAWPFTYEFNPHISLIYKTTAIKNRLSIIDNTHILMNYTFNRIAIVNTVGPVKDWDIEYQVNWNK